MQPDERHAEQFLTGLFKPVQRKPREAVLARHAAMVSELRFRDSNGDEALQYLRGRVEFPGFRGHRTGSDFPKDEPIEVLLTSPRRPPASAESIPEPRVQQLDGEPSRVFSEYLRNSCVATGGGLSSSTSAGSPVGAFRDWWDRAGSNSLELPRSAAPRGARNRCRLPHARFTCGLVAIPLDSTA